MRYLVFIAIFCSLLFALSNASNSELSMQKRQTQSSPDASNQFVWPEVDGPWSNATPLINNSIAVVGYWLFNQSFTDLLDDLHGIDDSQAQHLLFQACLEYLVLWVQDCWKISNASANANARTDTTARVIAIPSTDPNLTIDNKHLAIPVEFSCFERELQDDINTPLYDYTRGLLKQLKWDKADVLAQLQSRKS